MSLKLHQVVKDLRNSLPFGFELRGGSLAAPFGSVNPLGQKVFILSDPSHFRTMTCLQRHLITAIIGDDRDRTDNLCLARAALSQLSYVPLSI